MNKQNQCKQILQYVAENGSISSLEAIKEFGCTRLASRICDIKKMGYTVVKEREKSQNRYGNTVHYTRYHIIEGVIDQNIARMMVLEPDKYCNEYCEQQKHFTGEETDEEFNKKMDLYCIGCKLF